MDMCKFHESNRTQEIGLFSMIPCYKQVKITVIGRYL